MTRKKIKDFSGFFRAIPFLKAGCLLGAALFLASCGLEDYPVLYSIPQSNVTQSSNDRARVYIPGGRAGTNSEGGSPFSHYVIFYRIYVSDFSTFDSASRTNFPLINPALRSDYDAIYPYIDSETLINVNLDSLFNGRRYKQLELENANIDDVLDGSVNGYFLDFYFPSGSYPTMTRSDRPGQSYTLIRSNGNGEFAPRPDLHFRNSDDLSASAYINTTVNADVANKSGMAADTPRYTYVAMFIAAVGLDETSWSYIYSTPSLIHVFYLQDR